MCSATRVGGATGQRSELKAHRPSADPRQHETLLRERFTELGPNALRFLDGLLKAQRYGKGQAGKVLALLATYTHKDAATTSFWSAKAASANPS